MSIHPGEDVDIRDRVRSTTGADQIILVRQTDIEHTVKTLGLVEIPLDSIGDLLGCELVEVVYYTNITEPMIRVYSYCERVCRLGNSRCPCIGPTPPWAKKIH